MKAQFMTPAWIDALREEAERLMLAAGAAETPFLLVERYRGAPAEYAPGEGLVPGFQLRVAAGEVSATLGAPTDAVGDIVVEAIWDDAVKSVKMLKDEEYERFRAWRVTNGRLKIHGDPATRPPWLAGLHDAIGRRTR